MLFGAPPSFGFGKDASAHFKLSRLERRCRSRIAEEEAGSEASEPSSADEESVGGGEAVGGAEPEVPWDLERLVARQRALSRSFTSRLEALLAPARGTSPKGELPFRGPLSAGGNFALLDVYSAWNASATGTFEAYHTFRFIGRIFV